ncbi:MAG: DEAD/DEAH box helicase [Caldilineaceae bacterium SB0670_bin_27]|uniref:site-specific DNA-methyltransferase (adenine-specific) n=1 Tax=Caldilineaceae bacterium SB0664_bin_27 TaxID=2605260 RepID=A0A6B0YYH7_9CHLR|nr:DEAD/DEAH box helicase [Caldilineaceae bacterium SB0664_bin_27]MYJ78141.1 DEAD/DEAH box helicase [Caldilineaceae bacterium SB0670_bin_27]
MFQLKARHKIVKDYFAEIHRLTQLGAVHEGAVAPAFANLLRAAAQPYGWTLAEQYARTSRGGQAIRIDGALLDKFKLARGYWEAKDSADDLDAEISRKLDAGYPQENILFQSPARMVVIQRGQRVWDTPVETPDALVAGLRAFFAYQPPAFERWQQAVEEFKAVVPELAAALLELIEGERRGNPGFIDAFDRFAHLCRAAINPNISDQAVEEMLIQHLLTERIFRRVFDHPDFVSRNVIAREIEDVARALTSQRFSRRDFFRPLDRFYGAIETTAATINEFSEKQGFLNTVYEQFFQGFSIEVADTHGIVYTPQAVVDFMVRSVEALLQREFGRSLADPGVRLLDPFVGTGNFILRVMRHLTEIGRLGSLPHKYAHELHCNEVMLLPYYIAAMNIEHEYYELTGQYAPFAGICLVDTFELAEDIQPSLFAPDNTARVQAQQGQEITVIIGNPPYNVGQVNENDNNKNRKYATMDKRVRETYSKDSKATNKNALADPYVKAVRWAADRIGEDGIVSFVSNNGFLDGVATDGMRKHLASDFDAIYILDLGGNVRKNPKLSGTTHNVFGIQVGVSINFFVKRCVKTDSPAEIYYARVEENWRKEQKYGYLDEKEQYGDVEWTRITPDKRHTWLTEGLHAEFETFIPLGSREAKAEKGEAVDVLFHRFSGGVKSNRDAWVYNFNRDVLSENVIQTIETYNEQVFKWERLGNSGVNVDDFVVYDDKGISWSRDLKAKLKRGRIAEYSEHKVRDSLYRPFTKLSLFFDRVMNDVVYVFPSIFPTPKTETENRVIWLKVGGDWSMFALMVNKLADQLPQGGSQCFPFYTYDENGTNRRENITGWMLTQFRSHYHDDTISKWDIFHYVYGLLHHPGYRERYQANLKRVLPRLPFAPDFRAFAEAGARLADIHVGYEEISPYALEEIETLGETLSYRVEKMRLSKDRTQIRYNDFLALDGVPAEAFDYLLGSRSALEWVIDQYRVKRDKRSGIVNDPNRAKDPRYIVNLLGRVIAVSMETMEIVAGLPAYR